MSKQIDKSFFMFSPFSKYAGFYQELLRGVVSFQQLGNKIIQLSERACAFRQPDTVRELGEILSAFPIKQYQPIGHYYLATVLNRPGKGDVDKARSMFEHVADTAPPIYRAKAIHSLAAVSAHQNDFDSELYFFVEALKASCDIATSLKVLRGIAVHKAREGYHSVALKDLERMLPFIKYAPPHVYFDYLNSLAIELWEVGRKYEARNVIRHVLESPYMIAYPEWRETGDDLREANRSFVSVGSLPDRPRNVLAMPAFGRDQGEPPAWAGQPAPVVDYQQWKTRMAKKKKNGGNKPVDQMTVSEMMVEMMNIYTSKDTTDAMRRRIYFAVMKAYFEPAVRC